MTLSELNAYADKLDAEGMDADFAKPIGAKALPADILKKICALYQKVKPFFEFIDQMWFIPKKIKTKIATYNAVVESICLIEQG